MHLSEIWHSKKNDCRLSRTQVIKSNGPLLVYASNGSIGHAWVIDGYIRKYCERWEQKVSGVGEYEWVLHNTYLFHCVWGEAKVGDGYFRWDCLNDGIGGDAPELREVDDRKGSGVVLYCPHYYTGFSKR